MASLYVTEYASNLEIGHGVSLMKEPELTTQVVTYTGTAGTSAAFGASTSFVRLQPDGICCVAFGTGPTALTTNRRMTAGQTEIFAVPAGKAFKVSAITTT